MQDRRPDVPTRQGERLVGLTADLVVERCVVQRIGQVRGQSGVGQRGLDELPRGLFGCPQGPSRAVSNSLVPIAL